MSLTFIFRQGLPGKCLGKRPIINPPIPRTSAWDGGLDLGPFFKTFPWKSLTKNKGTACIYQDVLVMGSIYVIKYRFLGKIVDLGPKARVAIKDPVSVLGNPWKRRSPPQPRA